MTKTCRWFTALAVVAWGCLPTPPMRAAEFRSGEQVIVKQEETIPDNLYAFGRHVTIDGTVEGDLIVFAEQITINGTIKGDILGAGQTVVIGGSADDARVAGQVLKLGPKAKLDGDILAAGLSLECEAGSTIARDALFGGYQALFAGQIDRDLHGGMANCRLAGKVGRDMNVETGGDTNAPPPSTFGPPPPVAMPTVPGGLTIANTAEVTGKLHYVSPLEAKIDEGAKLTGGVEHEKPAPPAPPGQAAPPPNPILTTTFSRLRHTACVAIVGLLALVVLPQWSRTWADTIRVRPGASFLGGILGLIAFVALLFVALIGIIAAAVLCGVATLEELVPLVVVGGLVGYAGIIVGFWLIAAFLAEALTGLALGRLMLRDDALPIRVASLLLGVIIVALALSIPYVGPWIGFVVFIFGLGGFCMWLIGQAPPRPASATVAAPVAKA